MKGELKATSSFLMSYIMKSLNLMKGELKELHVRLRGYGHGPSENLMKGELKAGD